MITGPRRTFAPKELAEMRETIFVEIGLARERNDDFEPKSPDDLFQYDSPFEYIYDAIDALESIKNKGAEDMYVLALAAATTLIGLLEWIRDTGGVE